MRLSFTKMHGLGNDFVLVDGYRSRLPLEPGIIARLGDRRTGVGFDQLLEVVPDASVESGLGARIYNTDGSAAEHCGNGMRCFARFLASIGLMPETEITVGVAGARVSLELLAGTGVRVGMGVPDFEPAAIPLAAPARANRYEWQLDGLQSVEFAAVSIGNPHAVIDVESVDTADVAAIGPAVQQSGAFPAGVNVGFRQLLSDEAMRLRVFERGVGETMACGSGACAAAVTAMATGALKPSVAVELPGGSLRVDWQGEGEPVWLTGPTAEVFKGELEL